MIKTPKGFTKYMQSIG